MLVPAGLDRGFGSGAARWRRAGAGRADGGADDGARARARGGGGGGGGAGGARGRAPEREVEAVALDKTKVVLVGPTGSGKTLMARTLARMINVPLVIADATSLTQVRGAPGAAGAGGGRGDWACEAARPRVSAPRFARVVRA